MFISVIIPVYNKENYLHDCIDSVVSQSYKNLEIIIINDGSTDNSENIILDWLKKDQRIRYYKQGNAGVAKSRNRGIELAEGEYVLFLDADDELTDNAIHLLVGNAKCCNSDIIMGNYIHKQNQTERKRLQPTKYKYIEKDLYSAITKIDLFITGSRLLSMVSNKLYKLDFIEENGIRFDVDILAEDRLFNLKCYIHNPYITAIDKYTYIYKHLEDSRSQNLKSTFYEESMNLLYIYESYINKTPIHKLDNNLELMELVVIYDIFKIISMVFEKSNNKLKNTRHIINKLKNNKIVMQNLNNIFDQKKYKNIDNRAFNRMKLLSYLLYKYPPSIIVYKYLGLIKDKFNKLLN